MSPYRTPGEREVLPDDPALAGAMLSIKLVAFLDSLLAFLINASLLAAWCWLAWHTF